MSSAPPVHDAGERERRISQVKELLRLADERSAEALCTAERRFAEHPWATGSTFKAPEEEIREFHSYLDLNWRASEFARKVQVKELARDASIQSADLLHDAELHFEEHPWSMRASFRSFIVKDSSPGSVWVGDASGARGTRFDQGGRFSLPGNSVTQYATAEYGKPAA